MWRQDLYQYCVVEITISITDTGVGISADQIKKLGEPFYTTKASGNGLGLMVSYKILQNHKGKIGVNSVPGEGTEFIISFPVKLNN
ncbi:ATP-binding protein [Bacillus sp. T33-2]|uniref:ATP-binding protein n=1 Tax=Bacillus sp. T33-2 TaxID=2054168 RepID=UPI0021554FA3|nr:HAMP domain-containing sensor histidine kinase [Bacillus sp. T33-2]